MPNTRKAPSAKTAAKAPKAKKIDIKPAVEETRAADAADAIPDIVPLKEAMGAKTAGGKKAPTAKTPRPSGLSAAYQVLLDAGEPLQCKAIVEKMLAGGTWKTGGKTPEATIYAAIIREIRDKGDKSRFRKTERGHFAAVQP